jgi:transcriptional regulator
MYTPPLFREDRDEVLRRFVLEHPLATLISADTDGLHATHVPMFLDSEQGRLRAHMARANPHWRTLDGAAVLAVFTGPQHYISPSWYASLADHGRVVPTWNYVAVHVRGTARVLDDPESILSHVAELTDRYEASVGEAWRASDAPPGFIEATAKAIVAVDVEIASIEGKWKVSQNRTEEDRQGAIRGLERLNTPESLGMAELIRNR